MNAVPIRILLVEDNPGDVRLVREYLKDSALFLPETHEAECLERAVDLLKRVRVDLILADLSLPDSVGLDTFLRIQQCSPDIPIILLSGSRDDEKAVNALSRGAQDYLLKAELSPLQLQRSILYAVERVRLTRALRESEQNQSKLIERLREQAELLNKAQDAILVRDLENRILFWNKSAEKLYGWTESEAAGRDCVDLLYRNPDIFAAATAETMEKGEWVGELNQITKSGDTIIVEGHWTLVRDEKGNPKSVLAINTDITKRKALEQQFLRAQRMESIGTLAGGIAHDLNNVFSPIVMANDLLKFYIQDPEGLEILDTINRSAKRGAEMVSQVLSFAKGMDGRRVNLQVKHLVRDIEQIVRDTFPKNIQLVPRLSEHLWTVEGDPTQLHQVLVNLCVNARDAMEDGGEIRIIAENVRLDEQYAAMNIEARVGPHVRIEVEDNGGGIPKEILNKIFDPFFTTKETGKGTGLGLSTSLAIVKSHGGFIRAYSDKGMGSKFRIYLPAKTESDGMPLPVEEPDLPRGHGETVLVVDDEAAIRQITRHTLEAFGYRVLDAADGAEAVSIYAEKPDGIDVVLTDMMMPVMDGPATIKVLRRFNPDVRIIGASGITGNGKIAKAADAGVSHFLPKPYTAETLLKAIRKILT
ncbi:MAG: response regulator [Verrucomicrobia bacterium]|nr:response regulator [Verrucomicrobiota bacterium]MCH8528326.1 response regulator [Kiritimatiellia bacterium]